jgi:23S rRNA pseudouridine1911/1915/1917 synthase
MAVELVRLLDHLRTTGLKGSGLRKALESGKVRLHDVPTSDGGRMVDPRKVKVWQQAPRLVVGRDPAVIFKDVHLAVLWKPSGFLSVAAPRRGRDDNLVSWASRLLGRSLPVHRLDEGTSGLMLVARTPQAQTGLKGLFARHEIERRYLALVHGAFAAKPFTHTNFLVRDRGDGRRGPGQAPGALEATTHFERLQVLDHHASLVQCTLESGRTHQVRLHLEELKHTVLGDSLYGTRAVAKRSRRLALHAAVLGFRHPLTGKKLRFEAPLADDLEKLRRHLDTPYVPDGSKR